MNIMGGRDNNLIIDVERFTNAAIENINTVGDELDKGEGALRIDNRIHNCSEVRLENGEALLGYMEIKGDAKLENAALAENPKKGFKKPPKPPRPPRPHSLDSADQKRIREISEIAMLKKARAERMKTFKKTNKNGKAASSSSGNAFALAVTLIFCIVILWQGFFFPRSSSTSSFHGSPHSFQFTLQVLPLSTPDQAELPHTLPNPVNGLTG